MLQFLLGTALCIFIGGAAFLIICLIVGLVHEASLKLRQLWRA